LTAHDDLPVAARARRLEERLIAAGLTSDDEIDEYLTRLYTKASPVNGARMVARAWTDPQYRDLLLSDGDVAAKEMGFGDLTYALRVVPNTETTHNVIVCTLCSCYPARRVRPDAARRGADLRLGLDLGGPLHGAPVPPGRDRRARLRRAGRAGHQERADRDRPGLSSTV
jgi:hypothetical protein